VTVSTKHVKIYKIWLKFQFLDVSWQYLFVYTNIYHCIWSNVDHAVYD